MKVVAIIQARMGSTRLPGKVMLDLKGKPVLAHVTERASAVSKVDQVVVATTTLEHDDEIAQEAERLGVLCYRGSESDVLSRYYEAAAKVNADVVIRITSDCPMLDPQVCDQVIEAFFQEPLCDYCTNTLDRKYPRGLDLEVFSYNALKKAYDEATTSFQREHVTPYIHQNPDIFELKSYVGEIDYSLYRWTLDFIEDWELISVLFSHLYHPGEIFEWQEAIQVMQNNPHLVNINAHCKTL